jgi:hypothetical protein
MAKRTEVPISEALAATAPPPPATAIPRVIELSADGSHVGKSLLANRLRDYLRQAGCKTILVRIESRGIDQKLEPGDVFIASENFSRAGELPGGIVGVLAPLYEAIARARATGAVLIVDWASGLVRNRLEILAATRFDERLAALNMSGLTLVVTSNATDRMAQATEHLALLAKVAPGLQRGLVLNCRDGDFDFAAGSEQKRVLDTLRAAAAGGAVITIPQIRGGCWKLCEEAGYTMVEAMRAEPPEVAGRLNIDQFTATACITEIEAWWQLSEVAFAQVARFPDPAH